MVKIAHTSVMSHLRRRLTDMQKIRSLHSNLNHSSWDRSLDTCPLYAQVTEAAEACGLEYIGCGMNRMTVKATYYSKEIVIKLCSDGIGTANRDEINNIKKACENELRASLLITPAMSWSNMPWGLVVAFPNCPIINDGHWCPHSARIGEWEDSELPVEYHTEDFRNRLKDISDVFCDTHERNLGTIDNKIYVIDCDRI